MKKTTKKETSFHAGKQTNEASNKEKERTFSNKVYHKSSHLSSIGLRSFLESVMIFILTVLVIATVVFGMICVCAAAYFLFDVFCCAIGAWGGAV